MVIIMVAAMVTAVMTFTMVAMIIVVAAVMTAMMAFMMIAIIIVVAAVMAMMPTVIIRQSIDNIMHGVVSVSVYSKRRS